MINPVVELARPAPAPARGGGIAGTLASAVGVATGQGNCGTGSANGRRGFQPGNQCGKRERNAAVEAARKSHVAASAAVRKHTRAGTTGSREGKAALSAAAKAHRELHKARETHQAAKRDTRNTQRRENRAAAKAENGKPANQAKAALESARAEATGAKALRDRVERSAKEAATIKTDRARQHLDELRRGVSDGTHDGDTIGARVDQISRGTDKAGLFAAAKAAGVEIPATVKTKADLVNHLKGQMGDARLAGLEARAAKPSGELIGPQPGQERQYRAAAKRADVVLADVGGHRAIPAILGTTAGAKVGLGPSESGRGVGIVVSHPDYEMTRTLYRDSAGKVVIKNDSFYVPRARQGQGVGSAVFAAQVTEARRAGVARITTEAVRGGRENGYYTWARMGYDAPLHDTDRRLLPDSLKGARRVSDLMRTPEGRDHWRQNGRTLQMTFDLAPDSVSSRVHAAYLEERAARPVGLADDDAPGPGEPRGETPDFTEAELAAADRAWDRISTEGRVA